MSLSFLPVVVVQPFFPQKGENKKPMNVTKYFPLFSIGVCLDTRRAHTYWHKHKQANAHTQTQPPTLKLRQVNEWDLLFNFALQHTHTHTRKQNYVDDDDENEDQFQLCEVWSFSGAFLHVFILLMLCLSQEKCGCESWALDVVGKYNPSQFPSLKGKVSSNTLANTHTYTHTPSWAAKCKKVNMLNCGFFG